MLKVFVVFHETLHPGCYEALDADEFDMLTFVAVNPSVPKTYDATRFARVIREWELPVYDPTLQESGYCENSVLWHAHLNGLYAPEDRVLVLQWDMALESGAIRAAASSTSARMTCVRVEWSHFGWYFRDEATMSLLSSICNSFQDTFRVPIAGAASLYPLNNAYVLDGATLSRVVEWAMSMREVVEAGCADADPWLHLGERHLWKRIGLVYEHAMALALGSLFPSDTWSMLPGVWHPSSHAASDTPPAILEAVGTDLGCGFR
jgi:hypothetical protein